MLFLIKDNLGKRPIFFSWSDGGYPDTALGLEHYLVTQGMVRKLMPDTGDTRRADRAVTDGPGVTCPRRGRCCSMSTILKPRRTIGRWAGLIRRRRRSCSLYEIVYNGFQNVLMQVGDTLHAVQARSIVTRIQKSIGGP